MRFSLTVDLEDDDDIEAFLKFVDFHSKRLKCEKKDVFIKLAEEWAKAQLPPESPAPKRKPRKRKDDDDFGPRIRAEGPR